MPLNLGGGPVIENFRQRIMAYAPLVRLTLSVAQSPREQIGQVDTLPSLSAPGLGLDMRRHRPALAPRSPLR